jgi:hypothetical protein
VSKVACGSIRDARLRCSMLTGVNGVVFISAAKCGAPAALKATKLTLAAISF